MAKHKKQFMLSNEWEVCRFKNKLFLETFNFFRKYSSYMNSKFYENVRVLFHVSSNCKMVLTLR